MGRSPIGYDDYLRLANEKQLLFLHGPDELPPDRNSRALWQCRRTGQRISRAYHQVLNDEFGSHGQQFLYTYIPKYHQLAQELGIDFLFDETVDIGPCNTKDPVKWRGRNGNVVVASYYDLSYGIIKSALRKDLGLDVS